jgi:hypothetical protein
MKAFLRNIAIATEGYIDKVRVQNATQKSPFIFNRTILFINIWYGKLKR